MTSKLQAKPIYTRPPVSTVTHVGPRTQAADNLHSMKYRGPGEDYRECINRICFALKDNDNHYHATRDIVLPMRFMFGGRIQSAMGAIRQVTAFNCFASGTILDSYVDGNGCIMQRAHEAATTMRMGGGIGYDFSTLRPAGDAIKRLGSLSTGPMGFAPIFNAVCLATASAGHRRGAQMGMLRVDHPDIEAFVRAKQNTSEFRGFNFSIAVTDAFMEAALSGKSFDLRFGGPPPRYDEQDNRPIYRSIDAGALWEMIMRSTWDWGEPGVIFIDRINQKNNLWYCEEIACTNPCSEQPLPPFGACLLGSYNVVQYLRPNPQPRLTSVGNPRYYFDWDQLAEDIPHITRAMDNVTDKAIFPLPMQKAEAVTKRRMGIGVAGLANAGEALSLPYGSPGFIEFEERLYKTILNETYRASSRIAKEKGSFPLYDAERYQQNEFLSNLDEDVQFEIKKDGIRNSHLTSTAPTGTISLCADNISSGVEPVFEYFSERDINTPDGQTRERLADFGYEFLSVQGKLSSDVTVDEHLSVLLTAQKYTDSAVSKTINMDGNVMDWGDFKDIYRRVWEGGGKGCATFNKSGLRMGMMTKATDEGEVCTVDLNTGKRNCE